MFARIAALALLVAFGIGSRMSGAEVLHFAALEGWADDTHADALMVFQSTCDALDGPDWRPICALAADVPATDAAARSFFELFFRPVVIGTAPALFTGYYEPELRGSLTRTLRFVYPIYRRPPELVEGQVYHSRAEIDAGAIRGRGLELAWLEDPVEVYFLQVQGSGRIILPDGRVMRVGYAGRNGHAYKSVGQEMIRRGSHRLEDVSAGEIRTWVRRMGGAGREFLNHNPSYIFFRKLDDLSAERGPLGAMGRSITPLRSVAIDPAFVPLGAPVWVEKDGALPIRRLMVAQDTGGAIKGEQRADIYFGTGNEAGEAAGRIKDGGRLIQLLPIDRAFALLPEG